MSDVNKIFLIGRLTRDAEMKYISTGTAICNFSIAVGKSRPPQNEGGEWKTDTSFFDGTAWGRLAEGKNKYLIKGKQVAIVGELKQDRWVDQNTGGNRSKVKIIAESIQLLASPKNTDPANMAENNTGNPSGPVQAGDFGEFEDDIPF